MDVDALYRETTRDTVALEADGSSESSLTGAMEVDALYSETTRDVAALEADGSSESSLPAGAMDVRALYSEAMRDVFALEAAASSSESSPTWVSSVAVMQIDNNWIRCSVCSQNLLYIKCPVFQCRSGHLACLLCCAEPCKNCKDGGAKFVARNEVAEHVILCARFMCPHRGCHGFFTYSEVTAHNDACPQAPCSCAMPGCGFAGPPHALLRHLTSLHSWPAYGARYGKVLSLRVPASAVPCRRLILAVNDARVFALVVGKQCRDTAVSLVCVRAGASPWPSYKARLRACVLRQSSVVAGSTRTVAMQLVASSSRPGEVVVQKQPCVLRVPQTYQNTGDEGSEEVFLKIGIVIFPIDK